MNYGYSDHERRTDEAMSTAIVQLGFGLGSFCAVFVLGHMVQTDEFFGLGAWATAGLYYGQSLMLGAVAAMSIWEWPMRLGILGVLWVMVSFVVITAIGWSLEFTPAEAFFFVGGPGTIAAASMFIPGVMLRWRLLQEDEYYQDPNSGRFELGSLFAITGIASVVLAAGRYLTTLMPEDWLWADRLVFLAIDAVTAVLIGLTTFWAICKPGKLFPRIMLPIGIIAVVSMVQAAGFALAYGEDAIYDSAYQFAINFSCFGTVALHSGIFRGRGFVLMTHSRL